MRPFRFGTGIFSATSGAHYAEAARRVEGLGYSTLLLPDHFDPQDGLAPVPALVAAANATSSLRIGSLVFSNDFRHPAVLAKEAATIDLLTDGRLEFGIGAGYNREEYVRAGIRFDAPGARVERLTEAIKLIKALWTGAPVNHSGTHYSASDLVIYPRPVQRPHPPVFIGGGGRQLLSMAAKEADIVGLVARALPQGGLDLSEDSSMMLERKLALVREAAGERFENIELNLLIYKVVVTMTVPSAAAAVAQAFGLSVQQVLDSPYFLLGSEDAIVEKLLALRDRYGVSYVAVFPEDMEVFAPIVRRLASA